MNNCKGPALCRHRIQYPAGLAQPSGMDLEFADEELGLAGPYRLFPGQSRDRRRANARRIGGAKIELDQQAWPEVTSHVRSVSANGATA